ncbi:MAG: hypothetical protein F6K18_32680 [Okeania sp. SIO2C2]|nr:hypothetical protein [Okeania sp. SIO2C2]NEP91177.1 hypothetical protein [Okeania sp. SIO2C2]
MGADPGQRQKDSGAVNPEGRASRAVVPTSQRIRNREPATEKEARPELKELPQSTNFRPPQSAAGKEKETNGKKAGRATGSSRSEAVFK